jgi:hypothetical protein
MSNTHDLTAARAATQSARAKLTITTEAVARTRSALKAAETVMNTLAGERADQITRASHRIASAARERRELPALSVSDPDAARRHAAQITVAATRAALTELEAEEHTARAKLATAERLEEKIRGHLRQAEYDRIANQRRALWAQDEALAASLFVVALDIDSGRNIAPLTQEADRVLHSPDPRASVESLGGGHVLANFDTPICGEFDLIAQARRKWAEFDAALEELETEERPEERAA